MIDGANDMVSKWWQAQANIAETAITPGTGAFPKRNRGMNNGLTKTNQSLTYSQGILQKFVNELLTKQVLNQCAPNGF